MEILTSLIDTVSRFFEYVVGFFTSFIEAASSQLSAGNIFICSMLIIIIVIKIRKIL